MAALPLSTPQRRVFGWGVVVIALLLAGAVAIAAFRGAAGVLGSIGRPAPPQITQQLVVERLEEVAKLVATEMTFRDVVMYEQSRLGFSKRLLLVVTGRVAAGIDLQRGVEVRIDPGTKRIFVKMPPSEIMSVDILNVTTYDERAGLLNPFRPDDRDEIQRRIRSQLTQAAHESGILQHADESAAKVLRGFLSVDGHTVEIQRPVLKRQPIG